MYTLFITSLRIFVFYSCSYYAIQWRYETMAHCTALQNNTYRTEVKPTTDSASIILWDAWFRPVDESRCRACLRWLLPTQIKFEFKSLKVLYSNLLNQMQLPQPAKLSQPCYNCINGDCHKCKLIQVVLEALMQDWTVILHGWQNQNFVAAPRYQSILYDINISTTTKASSDGNVQQMSCQESLQQFLEYVAVTSRSLTSGGFIKMIEPTSPNFTNKFDTCEKWNKRDVSLVTLHEYDDESYHPTWIWWWAKYLNIIKQQNITWTVPYFLSVLHV